MLWLLCGAWRALPGPTAVAAAGSAGTPMPQAAIPPVRNREMGEASEKEKGKQYFAQTEVVNVLAQQLFSATPVSQAKLP